MASAEASRPISDARVLDIGSDVSSWHRPMERDEDLLTNAGAVWFVAKNENALLGKMRNLGIS